MNNKHQKKINFITDDYIRELKQHLNLSETAWLTINEDMHNFYIEEEKASFSGFMNKIFENFYETADATISIKYRKKHEECKELFSTKELNEIEKSCKNSYISIILTAYEKQLKEKAYSYPKGTGKKFRLNKNSIDILKESSEGIYYEGIIGLYLKSIFEEYAQMPTYKREQIFFKETIDKIKFAIEGKSALKLHLLQKTNRVGEKSPSKVFIVEPYKIVQDKTKSFNYLACYCYEENASRKEKTIASFRISRLKKVTNLNSYSSFLSKEEKNKLDEEITKKDIQYMAGDINQDGIIIKLTSKGIEFFKRQIYMRPQNYEKIDEFTYKFYCTELQAINYFFKFGQDAIVLSPIKLQNIFKRRYEDAYKAYQKINKQD